MTGSMGPLSTGQGLKGASSLSGAFELTIGSNDGVLDAKTRAWTRRLDAYEQQPEHEKRIRAQLARQDELVCGALSKLTGHPPHEFQAVIHLLYSEPQKQLGEALVPVLMTCHLSTTGPIQALRKALGQYEQWMATAAKNPFFIELMDRDFTDTEVNDALRASGARYSDVSVENGEEDFFEELPDGRHVGLDDLSIEGDYVLVDQLPAVSGRFLDYFTVEKNQVRALVEWFEKLSRINSQYIPQIFERFLDLTEIADSVFGPGERLSNASHRGRYAISKLVFSETTIPAIRALQPHCENLTRAQEIGAQEFLKLFSKSVMLEEALPGLLTKFELIAKLPRDVSKQVLDLIRSVSESERFDLLDALLEVSDCLPTVAAVRRSSICNEVAVVQKFAAMRRSDPGATQQLITDLEDLAKLGDRRVSIAHVLNASIEFLRDPVRLGSVFNAMRTYPKSHLLMPLYINALENGNEQEAKIFEAALGELPKGDQLADFANRFSCLTVEQMSQQLEAVQGDATSFVRVLMEKKKTQTISIASARTNLRHTRLERPWFEQLLTQFCDGAMLNRALLSAEDITSAHEALPSELRPRLRSVWQITPQVVSEFCADVLTFAPRCWSEPDQKFWFDNIVRDSALFARYRSRLSENPRVVREAFDRFSSEKDTTLQEVRDWILERDKSHLPVELQLVPSIVDHIPAHIAAGKYGRIIVWGRFHSIERREKLQTAAAGMPLILHDTFGRRLSDKNGVLENDLVICLTKSMKHKQYYGIKRDVASKGATLVCTTHEGTDILSEIIGKVASGYTA